MFNQSHHLSIFLTVAGFDLVLQEGKNGAPLRARIPFEGQGTLGDTAVTVQMDESADFISIGFHTEDGDVIEFECKLRPKGHYFGYVFPSFEPAEAIDGKSAYQLQQAALKAKAKAKGAKPSTVKPDLADF